MERLSGISSRSSQQFIQEYYQINPTKFNEYEGWRFPVGGPFVLVQNNRGATVLYCSAPGETPLYYNFTNSRIGWSEKQFSLGRGARRLMPGEMVIWEPGTITKVTVDELAKPDICSASSSPFEDYAELLIKAVERRLATLPNPRKVAIAQSGGLDSLLLAWACRQLGVEFIPLTVCTSTASLDYIGAVSCLSQWSIEVIPCFISEELIPRLLPQALLLLEDTESCNVRMQMGNILMAEKMQELGLEAILVGHGHDDVHGKGNLVKAVFTRQKSPRIAERWRDARRAATSASSGMLKMFSSCFRSHGLHCRLPYYDDELLTWAFSQPPEIIPVAFDKPFVRDFANHVLPPGQWQKKQHSIGYLTGAGLSLKQALLQNQKQLFSEKELRKYAKEINFFA